MLGSCAAPCPCVGVSPRGKTPVVVILQRVRSLPAPHRHPRPPPDPPALRSRPGFAALPAALRAGAGRGSRRFLRGSGRPLRGSGQPLWGSLRSLRRSGQHLRGSGRFLRGFPRGSGWHLQESRCSSPARGYQSPFLGTVPAEQRSAVLGLNICIYINIYMGREGNLASRAVNCTFKQ